MRYKVVVSNYWIGDIKYRRGDILEMSEERAASHGTKIEPYFAPIEEVKPKRKRRTKAEMELARGLQNEEV